ncbi:hypothetical protein ILUMI_20224 [Ignelater luminosus]|uniref:Zinc finger MYM-type protein 1-like n=1 Tax=Ignelater luminosus TaxID=2038154 RepID=A0A8K0CGS0_IGNLU|nr:hypothetical protein ILUMI_20224 [Ignelater luminosus]
MRASCGYNVLVSHLATAPANALYIIQNNIVKEVNSSGASTLLVDETSDISRVQQIPLSIRYITKDEGRHIVKEDFLSFMDVEQTTGVYLSNAILEALEKLNTNIKFLIGQGYDGAAAMKRSYKGVQKLITDKQPQALYVHCCAHSLNLSICHFCDVQSICNTIGNIKPVGTFFKASSKRTQLLRNKIKEAFPDKKYSNLIAFCETRWVENHNAILRFWELYTVIVEVLEFLSTTFTDIQTSAKSSQLLHSITITEFVVSLCLAKQVFSYTINLSKALQTVNSDLSEALEYVDSVYNVIQNLRNNIEAEFKTVFACAENLLSLVGEEMKISRVAKKQTNRCNIIVSSPEEYFRISIAIPFFDDLLVQINDRFLNHKTIIMSLRSITPKYCVTYKFDENFINSIKLYSSLIEFDMLLPELELWKLKYKNIQPKLLPHSALTALDDCKPTFFPNVYVLLKILAALPVSTSTPERTFSSLKRLKTYLRNSIAEDRLNGTPVKNALEEEQTKRESSKLTKLTTNKKLFNGNFKKQEFQQKRQRKSFQKKRQELDTSEDDEECLCLKCLKPWSQSKSGEWIKIQCISCKR